MLPTDFLPDRSEVVTTSRFHFQRLDLRILDLKNTANKFQPLTFCSAAGEPGLDDEVWDCGETLLVRNNDSEFYIALTDCLDVSLSSYVSPPFAKIVLQPELDHGNTLKVLPPVELLPYVAPPIVQELALRIDAARRE